MFRNYLNWGIIGGRRHFMAAIRVAVAGAAGRMGREVVRAVSGASDMRLVAAVDTKEAGDAGTVAGIAPNGVMISTDLASTLKNVDVDVLVDFTVARAALENVTTAIANNVKFVVGTSGMGSEAVGELLRKAETGKVGGAVVPNFALGAVLMMRFARAAARYFPDCEIIELHHDGKVDFPSGTAKATAHEIASGRGDTVGKGDAGRGVVEMGVPIHSVRLPGLVAHQEVLFGGPGQLLTIRHDSMGRDSFMPGVLLAVRKVMNLDYVVLGLDALLE
jgi:4-hydroxy-tetrahydrodipicolinate reductase